MATDVSTVPSQIAWSEPLTNIPPLEAGDHLDRPTFHARYEAMPESFRAELIQGVVHVPSPLKRRHGRMHLAVSYWLAHYENATPGTEAYDAASVLLGPETEPQPDLCLLISPRHGGQTWEQDDYIVGSPELLVEISSSTVAIDLHEKKAEYEKLGVKEYLVVVVRQQRVIWFVSRQGTFVELTPGADGCLRSEIFPGLWLDVDAAVQRNKTKMLEMLDQGLASPEHAAWVAELDRRAANQPNKPAQGN